MAASAASTVPSVLGAAGLAWLFLELGCGSPAPSPDALTVQDSSASQDGGGTIPPGGECPTGLGCAAGVDCWYSAALNDLLCTRTCTRGDGDCAGIGFDGCCMQPTGPQVVALCVPTTFGVCGPDGGP